MEYFRPEGEQLDRLLEMQRTAFGGDKDSWERYLKWSGAENFRAIGDAGGLLLIPMAQYYGGRAVPMTGIGAVAVSPEFRGQGAATKLMCASVREMHDDGMALSTLYPATEPLYRRAGYEQAGVQLSVRIALTSIPFKDRELACRKMTADDGDLVRSIHAQAARGNPGNLVRHPSRWSDILHEAEAFVFGDEAYIAYKTGKLPGEARNLILVRDYAATTARGLRHVLAFLAGHVSLHYEALVYVGPSDALLALIPEQRYKAQWFSHWMLRICHLENAITGRGFAHGLERELHLKVTDDVVDAHNGNWVVQVKDGGGVIDSGGKGRVEIDIRGLAGLYSGHLSVETLRGIGWIAGPDDALADAQAVFSGPAPWMPDAF